MAKPLEEFKKRRVLITGGGSFLAFHLAYRLTCAGAEVRALDGAERPPCKLSRQLRISVLKNQPGFSFGEADLTGSSVLEKEFDRFRPDYVVHIAFPEEEILSSAEELIQSQTGFLNLLECCGRYLPQHLLYIGGTKLYGNRHKMPLAVKDRSDFPASLEGGAEKCAEILAQVYSSQYQLPITGIRMFEVYGPYQDPDSLVMEYADSIIMKKPIPMYNHGLLWRDVSYIDDVIEPLCRILSSPPRQTVPGKPRHQIYNLGAPQPSCLLEVATLLEEAMGKKAEKLFLPLPPEEPAKRYGDNSPLAREVNFQPHVSLRDGLRRFSSWYLRQWMPYMKQE